MTANRPAALLFLRSLILGVGCFGAVVSGLLGDVALGQSTPTGFSLIPGGSFTMGRTSGDADTNSPPITVTVSPFYIHQTETTKAQWDEVRTWAVSNGYTDLAAGAGKASNHPVHSVNWWDVVKWCNARSEKEGLTPVYTVGGAVMRTGTTEPVPNWSANGYRLPAADGGGVGEGGAGRSEREALSVGDGHDQSCAGELPGVFLKRDDELLQLRCGAAPACDGNGLFPPELHGRRVSLHLTGGELCGERVWSV